MSLNHMISSTIYSVRHLTAYDYTDFVNLAYSEAKLIPRSFKNTLLKQNCIDSNLNIVPVPQDTTTRQDYFGNQVTYFNFTSSHNTVSIISSSVVSRELQIGKDEVIDFLRKELGYLSWKDTLKQTQKQLLLKHFSLSSSLIPHLTELNHYALQSFEKYEGLFDALYDLMNRIYTDFTFKSGMTTVTTSLAEVVKTMTGVCQDYSHFMIACVRSMGLACRYVSGYLETLPPEGEEKLQGVDASHAWVAVYVPEFGWLDFDPTNSLLSLDQHITVAWGRDYADVAPLKGVVYSGGNHELTVEVDIVRQG